MSRKILQSEIIALERPTWKPFLKANDELS